MTPSVADFSPPWLIRPAIMQTGLASLKFRKRGDNPVAEQGEPKVLECTGGVKLLGNYTKHPQARALVIFLHGWEGSENSTYVLCSARHLYSHKCSVFRLNFRDHGDSHHLNEELFHSARLQEVYEGVQQAANLCPDLPVYVVGFSLGGNFALRIVRALSSTTDIDLSHVFAISPVIDPLKASPKVDENPLIRRYFYKKWTTSLHKKQALFPDLYDFSDVLKETTVMGMSERFLARYTDFASIDDYFNAYRIWPDDLSAARIPSTLIMAVDDPVIPASHLDDLVLSPCVQKIMLRYGGHNGFFQSLTGPTWYDDYIANHISADTK